MQSVGFEFQKSRVQDCSTSSKWWEQSPWRGNKNDVEIGHIWFLAFCYVHHLHEKGQTLLIKPKEKILIKSSDKSMYCRKELKVAAVTHISLTLWQPLCCNAFMFSPREMLYSDLSHSSSCILWQKKRSLLKVCVVQNFTILGPIRIQPSLGRYILRVGSDDFLCLAHGSNWPFWEWVNIFGVWRGAPTGLLDYCY